MKMKRFAGVMLLCSLLLATVGNAQAKRVKASGKYETKEVNVRNFNKIKLLGSPTVVYTQSDEPQLKIYGSDNILNLVRCEVSGGTLTISFKENTNIEFGKEGRLKIMASSPSLTNALLQGSGDILLSGKLKCSNLTLTLQGSGDINAEDVVCVNDFAATLQGSGDIAVKNSIHADKVTLNLMGSGDLNICNLVANSAAATLQGSGDLNVKGKNVAGSVTVGVLGSGDLDFVGIKGGVVKAELNGSGDLTISGSAKQATLALRNSGDLNAGNLKVSDADATVNGSGSISCWVSGILKCNITGSGSIGYKGNPSAVHSTGRNKPHRL